MNLNDSCDCPAGIRCVCDDQVFDYQCYICPVCHDDHSVEKTKDCVKELKIKFDEVLLKNQDLKSQIAELEVKRNILQEAINEAPLYLYANKENWLDTHKSPNQRFMIIRLEDGERDLSNPNSPTYGGKSARKWIENFGHLRTEQVSNEIQ